MILFQIFRQPEFTFDVNSSSDNLDRVNSGGRGTLTTEHHLHKRDCQNDKVEQIAPFCPVANRLDVKFQQKLDGVDGQEDCIAGLDALAQGYTSGLPGPAHENFIQPKIFFNLEIF